MEKFDGGPVGLGTLSASIHEEKDSIEEIIEPYLLQIGFLNRTPRGRMATRLAYEHFGCIPSDEITFEITRELRVSEARPLVGMNRLQCLTCGLAFVPNKKAESK